MRADRQTDKHADQNTSQCKHKHLAVQHKVLYWTDWGGDVIEEDSGRTINKFSEGPYGERGAGAYNRGLRHSLN